MKNEKRIILTADDFGALDCIDSAIISAAKHGMINTVSAFVNFNDSKIRLKRLKEELPEIKVGLHLNITSGEPVSNKTRLKSLLNEEGLFYPIEQIIFKIEQINQNELEIELRKQIEVFKSMDIQLDHLSYQHNLLAIFPQFFDLVIKLAKEYNVPVRNPLPYSVETDIPFYKSGSKKKSILLGVGYFFRNPIKLFRFLLRYGEKGIWQNYQKASETDIAFPNHLIDNFYGKVTEIQLISILDNLPKGSSELIFHLGVNCMNEKQVGIDDKYFEERDMELEVLLNSNLLKLLKDRNIEIITYEQLKQKSHER